MAVLTQSDLVYQGAFRMPSGKNGAIGPNQGFGASSGQALAYNPAGDSGNGSLYISGHGIENMVAEVTIPTPVNTTVLGDLPLATVLQPLVEPTEGAAAVDIGTVKLGGFLVHGGFLYGTYYSYYDADNSTVYSHYRRPLNLTTTGQVIGPVQMAAPSPHSHLKSGLWGGQLFDVPAAHQAAVGAPALCGLQGVAIITRTSFGPAGFGFDPDDIGAGSKSAANPSGTTVPLVPLVHYPSDHHTLSGGDGYGVQSDYWNGGSRIFGAAFPTGYDSLLFFGRQGTGPWCYGTGTACGDPCDANKGAHTYPYRQQIWHYDINDLLAANNPWDVIPDLWVFTVPFTNCDRWPGGVAYDATNQRIFFAPRQSDTVRCIVHVFEIAGTLVEDEASLTRASATVRAGQSNTVTWADIPNPTATDWIGAFLQGTIPASQSIQWAYLNGSHTAPGSPVGAAGNFAFTIPGRARSGTYEFRLFAEDTDTVLATSATFTVTGKKVNVRL